MSPNPETPDLNERDVLPRLSRRGAAFVAAGAVVATVAVGSVGFLAAPVSSAPAAPATSEAGGVSTQSGQLGTLPLHDEKPMRAIGKGVRGSTAPTPSATPAPAATP